MCDNCTYGVAREVEPEFVPQEIFSVVCGHCGDAVSGPDYDDVVATIIRHADKAHPEPVIISAPGMGV